MSKWILSICTILCLILTGFPYPDTGMPIATVYARDQSEEEVIKELNQAKSDLERAQKTLAEHRQNKTSIINSMKGSYLANPASITKAELDAAGGSKEKAAQAKAEKNYKDQEDRLKSKVEQVNAVYADKRTEYKGKIEDLDTEDHSANRDYNNISNNNSDSSDSSNNSNTDTDNNSKAHNDVTHDEDLWGAASEEGSSAKVYAENVAGRKPSDPVIDLGTGSNEAANIAISSNAYTQGLNGEELPQRNILVYETSDQTLSWSSALYNELTTPQKREFMAFALKLTNTSGMAPLPKSMMASFIEQRDPVTAKAVEMLTQDYNGDLTAANQILKQAKISNVISWIIGMLCLAIAMFMMLSIVIDIVYLSIPALRLVIDNFVNSKNVVTDVLKPKFVSEDALDAIYECEKRNMGNVWALWIGKKFMTLLFISLVLVAIVSGKLFTLIGVLMDFIELVMHVFGF